MHLVLKGFKERLKSLDYGPCLVRQRLKYLTLVLESSSLTAQWVMVAYAFREQAGNGSREERLIEVICSSGTCKLNIISPRMDP